MADRPAPGAESGPGAAAAAWDKFLVLIGKTESAWGEYQQRGMTIQQELQNLAQAGHLTRNEAAVIGKLLEEKYPVSIEQVMCYEPAFMPMVTAADCRRLEQRLKLLKQLAASGALCRQAVDYVLPLIEDQVRELTDRPGKGRPAKTPEQQERLHQRESRALEEIWRLMAELRRRVEGSDGAPPGAR